MSVTVVYGWKGIPVPHGKWTYIHVPDETYENQYVRGGGARPYQGDIHHRVTHTEVRTELRRNGEVIKESTVVLMECADCGATS